MPIPLSKEAAKLGLGKKRSKYGAVRTEVDGIKFASKKEAKRYSELKLIRADFRTQVKFPLFVKERHIGDYVADFVIGLPNGKTRVEDVKGFRTPLYRWKKKHFEAQYGIDIREI